MVIHVCWCCTSYTNEHYGQLFRKFILSLYNLRVNRLVGTRRIIVGFVSCYTNLKECFSTL